MRAFTPPRYQGRAFHCPHCGVYADQKWHLDVRAYEPAQGHPPIPVPANPISGLAVSFCVRCEAPLLWFNHKLSYPSASPAPLSHEDMPDDVKADYEEARSIVQPSPRGAAALLRLCLQKLMPHLGEKGANIDDDIAGLVQKGLRREIQQALDSVRVIGNQAVHPGELDLKDDLDTATVLFDLLNIIVDDRISQPKKIAGVYGKLPATKIEAIKKRDGTA
jgi:hypothetical protein